jgi:hypothetical protein
VPSVSSLVLLADDAADAGSDAGPYGSLVANVVALLSALWSIVLDVGLIVLPWLPLVAWIVFWTFAVNWARLRRTVVLDGGWIGVLLLGAIAVLVWATIAPPAGGRHELLGLSTSNYVGKTIYVTALIVIAFLCGSVQLSSLTETAERFEAEDERLQVDSHGH